MVEFAPLIQHLCKRPGMYVVPAQMGTVIAFIDGFDHASDDKPLSGFREWLIVRANGGTNLYWGGIVKLILRPNMTVDEFCQSNEEQLFQGLENLLMEFIDERNKFGKDKILDEYNQWYLNYMNPHTQKKKIISQIVIHPIWITIFFTLCSPPVV